MVTAIASTKGDKFMSLYPSWSWKDAVDLWFYARDARAISAWRDEQFDRTWEALVAFYESHLHLFRYSTKRGQVVAPLLVRPEWLTLDSKSLRLHPSDDEFIFFPNGQQRRFLNQYHRVRKKLGQSEIWNGDIFRLVDFQTDESGVDLKFRRGKFFDAMMGQYILEHELRLALTAAPVREVTDVSLPLRTKYARTETEILWYCHAFPCRIGISNLLLFRSEDGYRPIVRRRGGQSLASGLCPVSSGIYDITTDPAYARDVRFKVLTEVYEELFGGDAEVARPSGRLMPEALYAKPGIRELHHALEHGGAHWDVTGLCVDLVRLVPEICTVLIVTDPDLFGTLRESMVLNLEYRHTDGMAPAIPLGVSDIEAYLTEEYPTIPGSLGTENGFDPKRWTLPGGFCFYQGVKRAFRISA